MGADTNKLTIRTHFARRALVFPYRINVHRMVLFCVFGSLLTIDFCHSRLADFSRFYIVAARSWYTILLPHGSLSFIDSIAYRLAIRS